MNAVHSLAGRVAVVTGAAGERSIGWGIARALAEAGADVVLCDIAGEAVLNARVRDLEALGRRALAVQADVRDPAAIEDVFAQAQFGRVDIAVANAGVIRWEPLGMLTQASTRAILGVNLLGTAYTCQAAARALIAGGRGGAILITSSVQSDMQFPITPVYGATKHAMHPFVGALALELAPHRIRVNHIGPGWVRSGLNDPAPDQQTEADLAAQRRAVPLHREGTIDEMGRAAAFLCSDASAYTTGAFLRIDGGLGIGKYSDGGAG
jgi:NAD(P)-dependent dehydrogenase (short-subunit alcohol dehydrogenase family)